MTEKRKSNNPNGRPKGVPNKATTRFKNALNLLLEKASDDMIDWLAEIENPKDRFTVIKDLAEYIHPKLARVESKQEIEYTDKSQRPIKERDAQILGEIGFKVGESDGTTIN